MGYVVEILGVIYFNQMVDLANNVIRAIPFRLLAFARESTVISSLQMESA